MYIPDSMKMDNSSEAYDFIDEFGFGVIVSECLSGTHLPFIADSTQGVLYSHFAKANPHWQALDGKNVVVIFNGPHSYISPSWYASTPAVPTWNYASVHAYGTVSLLDKDKTLDVVEQTVQKYESVLLEDRRIITDAFRDRLLNAIVGVKVEVSHIEGKLKLGQHRASEDQIGVYQALSSSDDLDAQALARYMKKLSIGVGISKMERR